MAATQFEHADQARLALRTVVAEHGPEVLSQPGTLANLLADLLPESPRIARIFVAAAQDNIVAEIHQHTSDGMDGETAARLAASSFAAATMFTPDACVWVAGEFALALGLTEQVGLDEPDWPDQSAEPASQAKLDVSAVSTRSQTLPDENLDAESPDSQASVPASPGVPSGEPPVADTSDLGPSVLEPAFLASDPAPEVPEAPEAPEVPEVPEAENAAPDAEVPGPPAENASGVPVPAELSAELTKPMWTATVTADRGYFDDVVAEGDIEVASIQFPTGYPERRFPLSGPEVQIGRRSVSRGLDPDIDLSQRPADPGVSHLHAVLVAQNDGTWAVVDPGSSNGTKVNDDEIPIGVPVTLRDGDRISLGAWTVLTIHAAPPPVGAALAE
jgi:hypothetical protein